MGVPVSRLSNIMSEREILYHLDDMRSEPGEFELFNELFSILNKNIVNCSDLPVETKRRIKETDFKLELEVGRKKKLSMKDIHIKARQKKYEGMVL